MRKRGLKTLDPSAPPPGVTLVKGDWPGVRSSRDGATAGPTGVPWVDSNGWRVRLARMRDPGGSLWVETPLPGEKRVRTTIDYLLALADAAVYGGQWIVAFDGPPQPDTWNSVAAALRFFAAHRDWNQYRPQAVVGILSDFRGANEFAGEELLNLTARQNQPYRILIGIESWQGLKAILYANAEPPAGELRNKLIAFVQLGGLLITGGQWSLAEGTPGGSHPRYTIRSVGKGRIAAGDLSDPYQAAADAQILLSHRHDLLRFWNGGSLGSYLTAPPSGPGALLQIVNYAGRPGADPVSVRVSGPYLEGRIRQVNDTAPKPLKAIRQKEAIELHLPAIPVYAAIELI
jgi:hypothetical protein